MKHKIMTFNLRWECRTDGINVFFNRQDRVLKAIADESPDIIGFQEATDVIRQFLRNGLLQDYVVLGCGRKEGFKGEGICIAYKRDMFELIAYDTFWLSDTPDVPGSIYENIDQSSCPRTTVAVRLRRIEDGEPLWFFNTHLDHKGEQARVKGIKQIASEIARRGGKFVLTGDMNARPDTKCIATALAIDGIVDATAGLGGTFHDFGRRPEPSKIDYIFTNGSPLGAYVVPDTPTEDGIYISDHYPVCAHIDI